MSIWRRPTRAAGHSWSKWEDPIVYAPPTEARITFLVSAILLGTVVGFLAVLSPFDPTSDPYRAAAAWIATITGGLVAWISAFLASRDMAAAERGLPR